MPIEIPFTKKAEDIIKLLQQLPGMGLPSAEVSIVFLKKMGYSASSSAQLLDILKKLGFVDDAERATSVWAAYVSSDKRASILATAIKKAYAGLFKEMMCPYLGDDKMILDYFETHVEATPREMEYCLETFRAICELADFQDILDEYDYVEPLRPVENMVEDSVSTVKVDSGLPMNIQIHIDSNTSNEKIDYIFKSMRKHLLGKE